MKKITVCMVVLIVTAIVSPVGLHAQCAMCGASVQSSEEGAEMAAGLNSGILYLLAIPYLIFMTFAVVIYRTVKRKKHEEQKIYIQN